MVAMAIASVLSLGIAEMMQFTNRTVKSANLSSDWTNMLATMRLAYSTESTCTNTFKGQIVSGWVPGTDKLPSPPSIGYKVSAAPASNFLVLNQDIGGFKATKLDIMVSELNSVPLELNISADVACTTAPNTGCNRVIFELDMRVDKQVGGTAAKTAVGVQSLTSNLKAGNVVTFVAYVGNVDRTLAKCYGSANAAREACEALKGTWVDSSTSPALRPGAPNCQFDFFPLDRTNNASVGFPVGGSTAGEKIQLWAPNTLSGLPNARDHSIGIGSGTIWMSASEPFPAANPDTGQYIWFNRGSANAYAWGAYTDSAGNARNYGTGNFAAALDSRGFHINQGMLTVTHNRTVSGFPPSTQADAENGERIQLWSGPGTPGVPNQGDFSVGISAATMWFNAGQGGGHYAWFNGQGSILQMYLNGDTGMLSLPHHNGGAGPSYAAPGTAAGMQHGERIQLLPIGPEGVPNVGDYAIGVEGNNMWFSSGELGINGFKFYTNNGTDHLLTIRSSGAFPGTILDSGTEHLEVHASFMQTFHVSGTQRLILSNTGAGITGDTTVSGKLTVAGPAVSTIMPALNIFGAGGNTPHNCGWVTNGGMSPRVGCPGLKKLVSGGGLCLNDADSYGLLAESHPDGDGWQVICRGKNHDFNDLQVGTVWAFCCEM